MRFAFTFVFYFITTINSYGQERSTTDSIQIVSMINDWNRAWDVKDYISASKWYSNDARFTNAFGDKKNGQKEIEQFLKEVFALPFVMTGNSVTIDQTFQPINPDNVIVHTAVVRKGQKMPDGTPMAERKTTHLRVFQKNGNDWQIKHI